MTGPTTGGGGTSRPKYSALTVTQRVDNYRRQTGGRLTPRQLRRIDQKANKALASC